MVLFGGPACGTDTESMKHLQSPEQYQDIVFLLIACFIIRSVHSDLNILNINPVQEENGCLKY